MNPMTGSFDFSRIAHIYDVMNHALSIGLIHSWRRRAARSLPLQQGAVILDLGTGTADLAISLVEESGPDVKIVGIDLAPEMLTRARFKVAQHHLQDQIKLIQGNAEYLDLPDNSVDGCCSAFLVRNLADMRQCFREMHRVVRPGGRVVCLEVSHPPGKILRNLFHCYFYKIAPLIGILLGQKLHAYQYLPHSLAAFPDAPALKTIMEECGWHHVSYTHLHGGLVAIHTGIKKSNS